MNLSSQAISQACQLTNVPAGYDPTTDPSNPCTALNQIMQNFSGAPNAQGLMVASPTPQQIAQYQAALPACQAWRQAHPCVPYSSSTTLNTQNNVNTAPTQAYWSGYPAGYQPMNDPNNPCYQNPNIETFVATPPSAACMAWQQAHALTTGTMGAPSGQAGMPAFSQWAIVLIGGGLLLLFLLMRGNA